MHSLNDAFRQILRAHRENTGLTQKELAKRLNVSLSIVKKWEHGDRVPPLRTFLILCVALEIKPSAFIDDIVNRLTLLDTIAWSKK